MIKIVLPGFPDKMYVKPDDISDVIDAYPVNCAFETEITTSGGNYLWDVDVNVRHGMWAVRLPDLSLTDVTTERILGVIFASGNGDAMEFIEALFGPIYANAMWTHFKDIPYGRIPEVVTK